MRFDNGNDEMNEVLIVGRLEDDMKVVLQKLKCQNDVSEVYSPPRLVTVAEAAGLMGGFCLDIIAPAPDGSAWDFSKHHCRRRALQLVHS